MRNVYRRTSYFDTKMGEKAEFYAAQNTSPPSPRLVTCDGGLF
jgi:hypothetical protein